MASPLGQSEVKPRIVIAGGSGFLGRSLSRYLVERDYRVVILSRGEPTDNNALPGAGMEWHKWDARTLGDWADVLDGAAGVVNLVGRSVDCRKTPGNKRVILESRVHSCGALGAAMRAVANPPPVWIQSGTAHYVGDPLPEDTVCDDSTPPGEGFAPQVGVAWERAFEENLLPTQRGVLLRISFVLGPGGGPLRRLVKLTRLGLGGTVGSGRQYISWIHHRDLNRLIHTAIEDDTYQGVYMTTAPTPVTNRQFMAAMRKTYHRPWSPPAPTFGVKLVAHYLMHTDPELALLGRRCVPTRLVEEAGFAFEHDDVERSLADIAQA